MRQCVDEALCGCDVVAAVGCDDRESPEPFVVFVDVEAFLGEFECGARVAFL